jgi:hypothetical protein
MRKISPSGALIMSGEGIAATRKKIEESFTAAREQQHGHSKPGQLNLALLKTHQQAPPTEPKPQRPLSEIVAPVLKVAVGHFKGVVVRHARYNETHFVHAPKESTAELFAACEKAFQQLNLIQEKSERHEIEEY